MLHGLMTTTFAKVFRKPAGLVLLLAFCLFFAPHPASGGDFTPVTGPCRLAFPRDHAAHPGYRIEWWYYTGDLESKTGERFGFQLTFFRVRTTADESRWPEPRSAWRTDQVFAAHAAVSDFSTGRFLTAETMYRAALGLAGTTAAGNEFRVFTGGWHAEITPGAHRLAASAPDFSFDLQLVPEKPPVPHGDSGYTRKGEADDEASCYYSITRLRTSGKLRAGGKEMDVCGTAWMDHEFSSAPPDAELSGWDWFSLRLSDGRDLMLYLMRKKDGSLSPVSSGTLVDGSGKSSNLSFEDFRVTTLDTWKSPHTGAVYPAARLIEVFPAGLRLQIEPEMRDQEVQSPRSTRVTYWEGGVSAKGTAAGAGPVSGQGYMELTGYAGDVNF